MKGRRLFWAGPWTCSYGSRLGLRVLGIGRVEKSICAGSG